MPWKMIKGYRYYYKHNRVDGRFVSTCIGRGELAELMAGRAENARMRRSSEAIGRRDERDRERELSDWFDRIESMASALMVAAGYRKHHRSEWRKAAPRGAPRPMRKSPIAATPPPMWTGEIRLDPGRRGFRKRCQFIFRTFEKMN